MKSLTIFILIGLIGLNKIKQNENISGSIYSILKNINDFVLDSSYIISSFDSNTNLKCLVRCTKTTECVYAILKQNKCYICKSNLTSFASFTTNGNSLIYQKKQMIQATTIKSETAAFTTVASTTKMFNPTDGLTNYWTFNGNVNDVVGNANLYGGVNAELTFDRFGKPNSALNLTNGYYQVPPGVYFNGTQFSISAWVKVKNIRSSSRLIDFGFLNGGEVVMLALSNAMNGKPVFYFQSGADSFFGYSQVELSLNQWQHLACVYSFPYYFIYINGTLVTAPGSQTTYSSFSINNVVRTSNFVGRSNWNFMDGDADADFDDLKIFNRSLSQQEIGIEMNNNL